MPPESENDKSQAVTQHIILQLSLLTANFLFCNYMSCRFWKVPPLLEADTRGDLLRAFDAFANDFVSECVERHEAGDALAARDIRRLTTLADRLRTDVAAWMRALAELDVAVRQPVSQRAVGQLVIDGVFDDALMPTATRLLRAALDLAAEAS